MSYFRQECSKLREELRLQHEEDKKSAMSQLLQLKEREKNAARDSWQKKVEDLLSQVISNSLNLAKFHFPWHALARGVL